MIKPYGQLKYRKPRMSQETDFDIDEYWMWIPAALKRRWWTETDYNKKEPSDELKQTIIETATRLKAENDKRRPDDKTKTP